MVFFFCLAQSIKKWLENINKNDTIKINRNEFCYFNVREFPIIYVSFFVNALNIILDSSSYVCIYIYIYSIYVPSSFLFVVAKLQYS